MTKFTVTKFAVTTLNLIAIILLIQFFSLSCGGLGKAPPTSVKGGAGTRGAPGAVALSDVLKQLDRLTPPSSVSPTDFVLFKEAFADHISELGRERFASNPPTKPSGKVNDLRLFIEEDGRIHLDWSYKNHGDYNQDGIVDVADIAILAENFLKQVQGSEMPELIAWIDGNGDGKIDIADVPPIAENFFTEVAGYRLEASNDLNGGYQELLNISFESAISETGKVKRFTVELSELSYAYYRVVPYDKQQILGIPSNIVPSTAEAPTILSASPTSGWSGESITFTAEVTGTGPLSFLWDFGGAAMPPTSEEESPTVTLQAPGEYKITLTVENMVSSAQYQFDFLVLDPSGIPQIVDIKPKGEIGYTGQVVQFTADVRGLPPFEYEWTFGTGALPPTSTDPAPFVTLQAPGAYVGNLLVRNNLGEHLRTFTYIVTAPPPPPVINSVSPLEGREMEQVTFTADVTSYGSPTYSWNFGDAGYPQFSNSVSPTVMLGAKGTFPCSLSVTDEFGTAEFNFEVTISSSWTTTTITRGANYVSLGIVDGRPAVGYQDAEVAGQEVRLWAGYAINSSPDGSGTWSTKRVDSQLGTGFYISLAEINGKPAVSYQYSRGGQGNLQYAISENADGLGNWTIVTVESGSTTGMFTTLLDVNGYPAIAYYDGQLRYAKYARSADPNGLSGWSVYNVDTAPNTGRYITMALIMGRPAIAYQRIVTGTTWLRFALSDTPEGTGGWRFNIADAESDAMQLSLAEVDGKPAVSYYDAKTTSLKYVANDSPDGRGNWTITTIHSDPTGVGGNSSLAVVNGYPMIAYTHFGENGSLWVAFNTEPDGSGRWFYSEVDRRGGVATMDTSLISLNNRPAIAYVGLPGNNVFFAVRDY